MLNRCREDLIFAVSALLACGVKRIADDAAIDGRRVLNRLKRGSPEAGRMVLSERESRADWIRDGPERSGIRVRKIRDLEFP